MFQRSTIFLGLMAALPLLATADGTDTTLQPTVQVTASRVAETVDQTLADVSVITRADIDASGARDVFDLLRLEPGVDIYRTGGAGEQTYLFLRGTNSNQVLILIDGVRAAAATTGAYEFDQLPIDSVERIEIVRGPRASYWGSDAIGGVIQIFTRKLESPRVALRYGSYRDAEGSAGIGHWSGNDGFSVQVGARHVGGFSATNRGVCNGPDDPYCIFDPDDDGYRNTNLAARGAYTLGSQVVSAALYRSQGQVAFDQGYSDVIEQTAGVNLDGDLADGWTHHLAVGNSREDFATPAFGTIYTTRRDSALWQNEFRVTSDQRIVAGIDYVHDQGGTFDTFAGTPRYRDDRDTVAAFGGWRATFGAFDSELSARHDDNSAFGGATTGSAALGWHASDALRFYANIGQGFRSPSFNDLYDPGYGGAFAGNPNLDPERSRSSELGAEFAPTAGQLLKANLYSTRINDLISFSGVDNQAINIAHAKIDGTELSYALKLDAWSAKTSYTWEDARDGDTDMQLLRRARNKASALLERSFGERFRAGAEVVYAGRRKDVGGVDLGAYAIVNLRANYVFNPAWSVTARLENLTDRDYELVHGYNTAGRSAYLDVVWQPAR